MSKKFNNQKKTPKLLNHSWLLIGLVLALTIFGVIMVGDASVAEAYRDFGDKYYYFRLQGQWALIGLAAFIFFCLFDYRHLKKLATPLLVFTLISLILVLIPGFSERILGAKRWIGIGLIRFQPAELAKISLSIYFASFFTSRKKILPFMGIVGLVIILVMLEPDLGTSLIIVAISLAIYFVSGSPMIYLGGALTIGGVIGSFLILFSSYRRERLLTFFNPSGDPLGASYHIHQALIAIGSGGLWGVGLGQSRQKYEYLPMAATDSIFAVIAEELGFVGAIILLSVFIVFIWKCFKIARKSQGDFGRYLIVGITSWIGFQTLLNLGAMVNLVPLTGVPLPFVSYGGSSLVLLLIGAGILVNISSQEDKLRSK